MSKVLKTITIILAMLALLSLSVAVPILIRPFYYAHIDFYHLDEYVGISKEETKEAYNEMLDFCIGKTDEFSTGVLKYSEEGKAHFEDVRKLFILDFAVAGVSVVGLLCIYLLKKWPKFKKHGVFFYSSTGLCLAIVLLGAAVATNFNKFFYLFHAIFFPGKDNWLFDPRYDQIIDILPEEFFRNCAAAILAVIVIVTIIVVAIDRKKKYTIS